MPLNKNANSTENFGVQEIKFFYHVDWNKLRRVHHIRDGSKWLDGVLVSVYDFEPVIKATTWKKKKKTKCKQAIEQDSVGGYCNETWKQTIARRKIKVEKVI